MFWPPKIVKNKVRNIFINGTGRDLPPDHRRLSDDYLFSFPPKITENIIQNLFYLRPVRIATLHSTLSTLHYSFPSDHPRLSFDYLFLMVGLWSAMVGGHPSPLRDVRWGLCRDELHARQLIAGKYNKTCAC